MSNTNNANNTSNIDEIAAEARMALAALREGCPDEGTYFRFAVASFGSALCSIGQKLEVAGRDDAASVAKVVISQLRAILEESPTGVAMAAEASAAAEAAATAVAP